MLQLMRWTSVLTALLLAAGSAPAVDSSHNAALRYWRAWTQVTPELEEAVREAALSWRENDAWQTTLDATLREELEGDFILMTTILRATSLPDCDFAADMEDGFFAILPHLGSLRTTARLLVIDARLASEAGDLDQAVNRLAAGYSVAQHAGREPFLISGLVSAASFSMIDGEVADLVGHADLSPFQKAELAAMLERFSDDDPFGLRRGVEGEAKATATWIREALERPGGAKEVAALVADDRPESDPQAWRELLQVVETHRGFDEAMAELQRYYRDVLDAWGQPEGSERIKRFAEDTQAKKYGIFAYWYAPDLAKVHENFLKSRASLAAAKERLR